MKLKKIDKSTLKPGDIVGIPYRPNIGWEEFRYCKIVPKKIKRITPARTKFVMEDGTEYVKKVLFYEINEESKRQTNVAECTEKILNMLYILEKLKSQGKLFKSDDKTIVNVATLLGQAVKELDC